MGALAEHRPQSYKQLQACIYKLVKRGLFKGSNCGHLWSEIHSVHALVNALSVWLNLNLKLVHIFVNKSLQTVHRVDARSRVPVVLGSKVPLCFISPAFEECYTFMLYHNENWRDQVATIEVLEVENGDYSLIKSLKCICWLRSPLPSSY